MKPNRQAIILIITLAFIFSLNGCVTVPTKESVPTYTVNGTTYYALVALCESRRIAWQFDTYSRSIDLTRANHKISLRVGDNLALIDGRAVIFSQPVDIYDGAIIVPLEFKQKIIDSLFKKEERVSRKKWFPLTKIKKVVIDAGHGGHDPGAIGKTGLREKDVNLDIANRLAALLKEEGVAVLMTRSTDKFIPLSSRIALANNTRADLFVSIHSNASRVRSLSGFEVYYVGTNVNDSKRAIFSARNAKLDVDSSCFASRDLELKAILWDLLFASDRAESIELSQNICRAIDTKTDSRIIGVKGARFEVLRGARMPAVLVETGFLSNAREESLLRSSSYREKIAEGILEGIRSYAQSLQ